MTPYKKFIHQYQGILVSIGIFVVIAVGIVVGIYPALRLIYTMRSNTSDGAKQLDVLQKKTSLLESIDEMTYKQYLTELALAVPTDKSLTSLFSTIDGLSTETGVTLSDFTLIKPGTIATSSAKKITTEEKKVGSSLLPFTLTVTGTYNQIHSFVEQSVIVRRFFRIRYFSIIFSSSDIISANMGMDAYYAPLPTNLGSSQDVIEPLQQEDEEVISKVTSLPVLGREPSQLNAPASPVETKSREDPFSL